MDRILRIPEVVKITGLSRTTIWRRVKSGDFPAPVRLGSLATRSVGWRESQIKQWLDSSVPRQPFLPDASIDFAALTPSLTVDSALHRYNNL